jgi:hypothetical protein
MSGHRSFQTLIQDFPQERLDNIARKQDNLARMELQEIIASTSQSWQIDPSTDSLSRVNACLDYLRQAVAEMGGELAITAKFPNDVEVVIDSLDTKNAA